MMIKVSLTLQVIGLLKRYEEMRIKLLKSFTDPSSYRATETCCCFHESNSTNVSLTLQAIGLLKQYH